MKAFGLWVLFLVIGAALMCLNFSSKASTSSGKTFTRRGNDITIPATTRKLQENRYTGSSEKSDAGKINLEDYRPIDPAPSSKASIGPGPIQHGTPLLPYIPKPSPPVPGQPKQDGFP